MEQRTRRLLAALIAVIVVGVAWPAPAAAWVTADQPARLVVDEPDEPLPDDIGYPAPEVDPTAPVAALSQPNLDIKSKSAILVEPVSGTVLFAKEPDLQLAPASMTKIMTLLIALEAIETGKLTLTENLVASENAMSYGGTQIWLEPGEEMSIEEILLAVAVGSANDACVALAEHMCGSEEEFVDLMNQRAAELGMTNTHFANSHGLDDPDHYTTSRDMALLAAEAVRHPDLLHYTSIYETHIRPGGETWLVNRNTMLNYYQGCDGLKTGWTGQAGYSITVTAKRNGTRFVVVVMDSVSPTERTADCTKMLNYAFANFSSLVVAEEGHPHGAVKVDLGVQSEVQAVSPSDQAVLLEKGGEGEVSRTVVLEPVLKAPVRRGDQIGTISVSRNGGEIAQYPLVADRDSDKISFVGLWWRLFRKVLGG